MFILKFTEYINVDNLSIKYVTRIALLFGECNINSVTNCVISWMVFMCASPDHKVLNFKNNTYYHKMSPFTYNIFAIVRDVSKAVNNQAD